MSQFSQQIHVAQHSRREKLRIPGSQQPLSSPSEQTLFSTVEFDLSSRQGHCNQPVKHLEHLRPPCDYVQAQSNINDVAPVYNTHMISSDPYNFPTGAELLAVPRSHLSASTSDLTYQKEGISCSSSVTSINSVGWCNSRGQLGDCSTTLGFHSSGNCMQGASRSNGSSSSVLNSITATFPPVTNSIKESSREANMATYLPGSNVQADAMQTLYLMNPSYAGYSDPCSAGNMVLISPPTGVGQGNPLTNTAQQQHYIGFPLPPVRTQNSLPQQSTTVPPMSTMGHQLPNRISNQTYNSWNGQSELPFISSNDVTHVSQSIAARLASVNSGQHSASDVSQYSLRHQSLSPLHDQQTTLLQNNVALGLNMENTQISVGPGQGLSLSLSPQQPSAIQLQPFHMQVTESGMSHCATLSHVASEDNSNRGERVPNKWTGSLSSFHAPSRDGILGTGYQNTLSGAASSRQTHLESSVSVVAGTGGLLTNSKYLKAAQQLLDEVVSFGRGIKNSSAKHIKVQTWMGSSSIFDGSFAKDNTLSDTLGKDGTPNVASTSERTNENNAELTPAERQELQMKKAKLMAMLDEVDRRYRQYYSQLQIVVSSFESAAGLGAAKTYTALALQTISKHFRCLRDAIGGQIRATSKALGEEDPTAQGRGETSRLRFVDQQLRQQRALQQLGMMQQHAWRPQRGLPERSVSILRAWLFEHFLHPYPKDADKVMLARQTGLTRSQVSNWFINARVRLWKPMVEEMYLEETRDAETETGGAEKKARGEAENASKGASINGAVGGGGECHQGQKEVKMDSNEEGIQDQQNGSDMMQTRSQGMNIAGSTSDCHPFHEKDSLRQGLKVRNGIHDSVSLLSPNMSMDIEMRSQDTRSEDVSEFENKPNNEDRHRRNNYTLSHSGLVQAESLGGFGSFQNIGGMATRYPGSGNVSLTLGLQHCDGLSLSGGQQNYLHGGQGLQVGRREDGGSEADDYYSINESSIGQGNSYEAMNFQNRKRFATQFLQHDFVA